MSVGAQQQVAHSLPQSRGARFLTALRSGTPAVRIARSARAQAWPERYALCLRITDSAVVLLAGFTALTVAPSSPRAITALAIVAVVWPLALEVYGSREASVFGIGAEEYRRVVAASIQLFAILAVAAVFIEDWIPPRMFALVFGSGLLALLGLRWVSRRWLNRQRQMGLCLTPAIVVGEPDDVRYVARRIALSEGTPYNILGAILPGGRRGQSLAVDGNRLPVLSSTDDVVRTVALKKAAAVIIAGPVPGGNQYVRELGWDLEQHDAELVLASSLTNVAGPRIHWRPIQGLPLMEVDLPHYSGPKNVMKRAMDIAFAAAVLAVLSPVLLVLALVVHFDSPGPALFRQERLGKDGKPFEMLKFRSMLWDGEARVTRSGQWMRRYSLDGLPQFVNVLRGEMSIVGPRPPLAQETGDYARLDRRRMLIRPGITGLWHVNGRSDLDWDDSVRLDLYYVENWSVTGDLMILWRRFRAIFSPLRPADSVIPW